MNYIKTRGARLAEEFFTFHEGDGYLAALKAAREVQPTGPLAVFQPLRVMPDELRCVGHAPVSIGAGWQCVNCGQLGGKN